MPARQSVAGGGKPPAKTKTPKATQPVKQWPTPKIAKQTVKSYGSGATKVFTTARANPIVTNKAVKRINTQVGRRVFKTTLREPRADIIVKAGHRATFYSKVGSGNVSAYTAVPSPSRRQKILTAPLYVGRPLEKYVRGARMHGRLVTGNPRKVVKTYRHFERRVAVKTREHELGHAVGLGHSGPQSDPYLFKKRKAKGTGIMGHAGRLNSAEVAYYRALAATQRKGRKPHGSGKKAR